MFASVMAVAFGVSRNKLPTREMRQWEIRVASSMNLSNTTQKTTISYSVKSLGYLFFLKLYCARNVIFLINYGMKKTSVFYTCGTKTTMYVTRQRRYVLRSVARKCHSSFHNMTISTANNSHVSRFHGLIEPGDCAGRGSRRTSRGTNVGGPGVGAGMSVVRDSERGVDIL
jgi:hypothetical protein